MSGDERLFAVTSKNHSVTRAPKSLDVAGGMGGLPKLLDNCKDYHFDLLEVERRNAGIIDLDELETWKRASKNDAPESHRNAGATACASARTSSARGRRPSRVRDVRRRVRVQGRLQERQDGGQVHVHRRGRVRGRLCIEERRAQEEGSQASRARGRRAQEEGGQVGFEVSFPSGRARATFEILRILKQTRILGSQAEILLNLLKRILGGVQAYAEKFC